jgi:hypothetical protein
MELLFRMRLFRIVLAIVLAAAAPLAARHGDSGCGTTRESAGESLFLHRQSTRFQPARALAAEAPPAARDIGNIAIIEDSGGVVGQVNLFDLGLKTLTFTPTAAGATHYRYSVALGGYDDAAAGAGTPLAGLADDDTRQVALPFAFPFFGAAYTQVFVNSDGNLTFTTGDYASTDRSLGRMTAGPPRIAPLFDDLDPSQTAGGVRVLVEAARVVVSWVKVREWQSGGPGAAQTFQARLYPDGRIEFSYAQVSAASAIAGIAPGNAAGPTSLVSFIHDPSGEYSAAVVERFSGVPGVDVVLAARVFYQTHEDAYDYLVIYNNQNIDAGPAAVAIENTVRSTGSGYGAAPLDIGREFGSTSRLQAVLNMGELSQYLANPNAPADPNAIVPRRLSARDTPLTILGHETGHLFLAYTASRGPTGAAVPALLNTDGAHWSFVFNSEASLVEGERIRDNGAGASPRFLTIGTVEGYSPLDRYLMGFEPASAVPPTFVATGAPSYLLAMHPVLGYPFDGARQDVSVDDIIRAEGRRTPDFTVAQHRFRFGFILVVPAGTNPTAAQLAQLETYRTAFVDFFPSVSANIGLADTGLARSMKLSLFPNAGVVAGGTGTATLTVETAPAADMPVRLDTAAGYAVFPPSVTIPAGAKSVAFTFSGVRPGVEEVTAAPPGGTPYEIAFARVQVADASMLRLLAVSGDGQRSTGAAALPEPVVVRLTDANGVPYPGAILQAAASAGGSVFPASVLTDAQGRAAFSWAPGTAPAGRLTIAAGDAPSAILTIDTAAAPRRPAGTRGGR